MLKTVGAVLIAVISIFTVKQFFPEIPLTNTFDDDYDYIIGK